MNMRYVTAWVAALVCASLGSASLLGTLGSSTPVEVAVTIDWQVNQQAISPTMVGISVSAGNHGNGIASGGLSIGAVTSTAELRAKLLRFPDDDSQAFHWDATRFNGQMSTFEFWSLADQAQVQDQMITVNMVSGTRYEAQGWVEYCNLPATVGQINATMRKNDGSEAPLNIEYWLLGERLRDFPDKFPTGQQYAIAALENASRMKAVSPGIQIGMWLDDGSTPAGEQWNKEALQELDASDPGQGPGTGARLIDFIAVDVVVSVPNRPITDAALYPTLYGDAAAHADQVVTKTEGAVGGNLSVRLPIAITRYGIDFGREGWNGDKADSLGTAIALSGMLNAFVQHESVITAVYAGLNNRGFNALLKVPPTFEVTPDQRFSLNPYAEVLENYGQYLEGRLLSTRYAGVGSSLAKAYYKAPAVGKLPATDSVPLLSIASVLDTSNGQMVVYVASRSLADTVKVRLTVSNVELPAVLKPNVLWTTVGGQPLATDTYTGVTHVQPDTTEANLNVGTPTGTTYLYDITLPRNSVTSLVFRLGG